MGGETPPVIQGILAGVAPKGTAQMPTGSVSGIDIQNVLEGLGALKGFGQ